MSTQGVAISLFSGAGGLDLGAEWAGYEARAAVEWDRDAVATMEKNFSHLASPVICKDILDTPTAEILRAAGLRPGQRPDLLIGGPPCTPFSKSGFWRVPRPALRLAQQVLVVPAQALARQASSH